MNALRSFGFLLLVSLLNGCAYNQFPDAWRSVYVKDYDFHNAALVAFSDKKTLVGSFSDGTKTQSDIRRGALQSMKDAKGQKLFVSCFQTRQKGKRRLEYSEHIYPVFVKPDGSKTEFLSYRTHRLKRVVQ